MLQSTNVLPVAMRLDQLDSYEGIKMVSNLMRSWERAKKENTFKLLAQRSGLNRQTVQKMAGRQTFAPRMHTILAILSALGFKAVRFE